jgi:hypothetical protein
MGTSRKPDGLWKMSVGEREESLKKLEQEIVEKFGSPRELFDRLRLDAKFASAVAEFMVSKGRDPKQLFSKTSHVRKIMDNGTNFFGIEDYENLFGVTFTREELDAIPDFPWSKKTLNSPCPFNEGLEIKDTHFAFLGLENFNGQWLSMIRWKRILDDEGGIRLNIGQNIASEPAIGAAACKFRWYLMTLSVIPGSTNCNRLEQMQNIPEGYNIPYAIEEITKRILYFKKNGVPSDKTEARCRESVRRGFDVSVFSYEDVLIRVAEASADIRAAMVGLALSRKPENK